MRFATLCSGVGAPEVSAHRLGMEPVFFSEIEPFPCAVLAHHWPDVPNYGDMTAWRDWPHHDLDLLIAGTPCQAFSVAGLRQGLDDARGNLTLEFARYADHVRPRFVLWENVPGVLSDKSNAFGCLLAGLAGCDTPLLPRGKRWGNAGFVSGPRRQIAWRVLDAQHFGVAQRRRRVWLCAGDVERGAGGWACARALFPERGGVRGDSPQDGAAREEVTGAPGGGSAVGCDTTAKCLTTRENCRLDSETCNFVAVYENHGQDSRVKDLGDIEYWCPRCNRRFRDKHAGGLHGSLSPAECPDCGEEEGIAFAGKPLVRAFNHQSGGDCRGLELRDTAQLQAHQTPAVLTRSTVRRLTPRECERLQGFPDDHTRIWKKRFATSSLPKTKHFAKYRDMYDRLLDGSWVCNVADGPRYKALGNSMAVPCVQFILGNLRDACNE